MHGQSKGASKGQRIYKIPYTPHCACITALDYIYITLKFVIHVSMAVSAVASAKVAGSIVLVPWRPYKYT